MRCRQWLLPVAPALLAGLLAGCGGDEPATVTATKAPGDSWVVVAEGSVSPSAVPAAGTPSPGLSTGFLPWPSSSVTPPATATPGPNCTGSQQQGPIDGLTVVPGRRSARVSWHNPGGANLVSYRVTAIPQDLVSGAQPELEWKTITPDAGCGTMTTVLTGLESGEAYTASVDAVTTRGDTDRAVGSTVARSELFYPR
ncbi:MAG TPA: fibronectin type III domain-containing protein [Actinoplanes sp.]|nr:fibronectin type III domain-containing protein [Actinoplanes sp.]